MSGEDRIFILIRAPNGDTREVAVGSLPIVLGRDESADVRVEDRKVSRRHAAFRVEDGVLFAEDLGSANGVKLNGKRIDGRGAVSEKDLVHVGGYEVRLKPGQASAGPIDHDRTEAPVRHSGPTVGMNQAEVRQAKARSASGTKPKPVLIGLDPPVKSQRFTLERGDNVVGRLEDCQVSVLDGSMSRQHARLEYGVDRVRVIDLNSANGVFVNGVRVDRAELNNADRLRFGNVNFRVELPAELAVRIGPVRPKAKARPTSGKTTRGRGLLLAGTLILSLAAGVLFVAVYRRYQLGGLAGLGLTGAGDAGAPLALADARAVKPVAVAGKPQDAGAAEPAKDGGMTVASVSPNDARPVAPTAPEPTPPVAPAPKPTPIPLVEPKPSDGPKGETAPVASLASTKTATSPYGKKDAQGWPLALPEVDTAFDFDGYVSKTLSQAEKLEQEGKFKEVQRVIRGLRERDPVNRDAQAMLERAKLGEETAGKLAEAQVLRSRGRLLEALSVFASVPEKAPQYEQVKKQFDALKPAAFEKELERAGREAAKKKGWNKAHTRLVSVLDLDPTYAPAEQAIQALEQRMLEKQVRFRAYVPKSKRQKTASPAVTMSSAISSLYSDRVLARIIERYAEGGLDKAISSARGVSRKSSGARKKAAARMGKRLTEVRGKYKRVKTALGNDPGEAWAHLIELEKTDSQLMPPGFHSYVVIELRNEIADEYSGRGDALFQQKKYEAAFQQWTSATKLNPRNARAAAGVEKLEAIAEKEVQEIELAAQTGAKDTCERWRGLTRITRSTADVYKKASKLGKLACSAKP